MSPYNIINIVLAVVQYAVRGYSVNFSHAGTHNGKFHCDEVLACYMLTLLPEYSDAEIIRTRDPKVGHTLSAGVFNEGTKLRFQEVRGQA